MPVEATNQLWWVCAKDMISDELTKSMRWDLVRELVQFCRFHVSVKPIRAGFVASDGLSPEDFQGRENHDVTPVPT